MSDLTLRPGRRPRKRRSRDRIEKGIRYHGDGIQAYRRVHGKLHFSPTFAESEIEEARAWYVKLGRDHFAGHTDAAAKRGTFEADVQAYLLRRAAMPTIGQVRAHLALWLDALGRDRPRNSVKTAEVDVVIQRWLAPLPHGKAPQLYAPGRKGRLPQACGLDTSTIRKRRYTLRSFYIVMNGEGGYNPVQAAQNFAVKPAETRGTDYGTIARILAAMPDYHSHRRGTAPAAINLSKLRATVIAATGLPPGLLAQIRPADLHLDEPEPWVHTPEREKGDGIERRRLKLSAAGVAAFRVLDAVGGLVEFEPGPLCRSWQRARQRAHVRENITIYDLRHSFGAEVYRLTGDEATVARLLLHAEGSPTTARYTRGAHAAVDAAAVAGFNRAVAGAAPTLTPDAAALVAAVKPVAQLPRRVATRPQRHAESKG